MNTKIKNNTKEVAAEEKKKEAKDPNKDKRIITGTIHFAHLFDVNDAYNPPKYDFCLAISEDSASFKSIKEMRDNAAEWGKNNLPAWEGKIPDDYKDPIKPAETLSKKYEGTDNVYIRVKSKNKPTVVDRRKNVISKKEDIPDGSVCNVICFAHPYPFGEKKADGDLIRGVSFGFNKVQLVTKYDKALDDDTDLDFDDLGDVD